MRPLLWLLAILLLGANASGGVPSFFEHIRVEPLQKVGVQQGGRVTPIGLFAEDFVRDVHGKVPMRIDDEPIHPLVVLLECVLVPERALEWCTVAGDGREPPRLAGEALNALAFGVPTGEADAERTGDDAVLEARLMLLVFAAEELRVIPTGRAAGEWNSIADAQDPDLVTQLNRLRAAWSSGDAPIINDALAAVAATLADMQRTAGVSPARLKAETLLARAHLLSAAVLLYAIAALLAMMFTAGRLCRTVMGLALIVHLVAALARAFVMDRLPIQNHYESMVAVAALVAGAALLPTLRRPNTTLVFIGALMAAAMLAIAEWLDVPGRVLELEAGILSSTAILKYHVLTILAGYALIMLGAGVGGAVLVNRARGGSPERIAALHRLQVNLGFWVFWVLGLGILLGAVWADRAWGRWWAFDPKETWALITWLVYLAMVHIPASKLAVPRRPVVVALLHMLGLLAMLWTYFGVNLLLPSLHSYAERRIERPEIVNLAI